MKFKCITDGLKDYTKFKDYNISENVTRGGENGVLIPGNSKWSEFFSYKNIIEMSFIDNKIVSELISSGIYFVNTDVKIDPSLNDKEMISNSVIYRIKLNDRTFITIESNIPEDELLNLINKHSHGFVKLGNYIVNVSDIVFIQPEEPKEEIDKGCEV